MVAIQCARPSTGAGVLFGGRGRGARLRVEPLNTCAMQIHAFSKFYERAGLLEFGVSVGVGSLDSDCLCANSSW